MKKRILCIMLVCTMILSMVACNGKKKNEKETKPIPVDIFGTIDESEKYSLNLYFCDMDMGDYFRYVADTIKAEHPNITVTLKYSDINSYVEKLVSANANDSTRSDVYILPSDQLERAYMAGMTTENVSDYSEGTYAKKALEACTLNGKKVAYPISFSTQVFLMNNAFSADVPKTFEQMKDISANIEVSEGQVLERIFAWDITDMSLNYNFIGFSANICGEDGADTSKLSINNEGTIKDFTYFLEMSRFFNNTKSNTTKEDVINSFANGRTVFALVGSNDLIAVSKAIESSESEKFSYTIKDVPNITDTRKSAGISTTYCAVVNPYSKSVPASRLLAEYLSDKCSSKCLEKSGVFPAKIDTATTYSGVYDAYERSVIKCRLMDISDFYTRLEIAFNNIANGDKVEDIVKELDDYLQKLF